jgi:hypothetical protein
MHVLSSAESHLVHTTAPINESQTQVEVTEFNFGIQPKLLAYLCQIQNYEAID